MPHIPNPLHVCAPHPTPAGFDAGAYRAGHTAGWEHRRREIAAEPYNFLFHVLRDENATTSDRIAAASALMQHHRLADLDLTDGVGSAPQ